MADTIKMQGVFKSIELDDPVLFITRNVIVSGTADRTRQTLPSLDIRVARSRRPFVHSNPTSKPPRATRPETSPVVQDAGRAGRRFSSLSCD